MEVFVSLRRRPIAGVGLVVTLAWIGFVAFECFTTRPLNTGGPYANTLQTFSLAWPGVVGVAALTWLLEGALA